MEAFCLLAKHLRGGCAEGGDSASTIIAAAVSSDGEDGPPYFDLEFTQLEDKSRKQENGSSYAEDDSTVTAGQENVTTSGELLFNGEFVPIESSTVLQHIDSDQNCKFPVSVLKSASKFGVVLLKLKKSKPERTENMPKTEGNHGFAFRFQSQNAENSESNGVQDQDRKSKQHYFKMVKPLYVRISKAKMKFYGQLSMPGADTGGGVPPPDIAAEKVKYGTLKVVEAAVTGHAKTSPMKWMQMGLLSGKSRSASAAVEAAPAPSNKMACNRRDDSLLQVQDGIQGAILHCKRSFNASIYT